MAPHVNLLYIIYITAPAIVHKDSTLENRMIEGKKLMS